jgi:hypothetical protein
MDLALGNLDLNAPAFVPSGDGHGSGGAAAAAAAAQRKKKHKSRKKSAAAQQQQQKKKKAEVKEVCRNFQAGRCHRGDNCPRRHCPRRHGGDTADREETARQGGSRSSSSSSNGNRGKSRSNSNRNNGNNNKSSSRSKKKNTESFNPEQYLAPPDIRVRFGPAARRYNKPYSVHDVVVAPDLFCDDGDFSVYDDLLSELKASGCGDSLFVSWHGDSHVIADDKKMRGAWKENSPTFTRVVDQMREYFKMDIKATRFNWYRDQEDWKPFHHDAAAIKPRFAKMQNITVAASFGQERDIGFEHAQTRTMISLPQPNGSMYAFGRDVNCEFRHGVIPVKGKNKGQQKARGPSGRISIIAWGWVDQECEDSRIRSSP